MATISCKECGQTVSTNAKSCPHCGAGRKKFKNQTLSLKNIILFSIVAFVAINIFGTDNGPGTDKKVSKKTAEASGPLSPKSIQSNELPAAKVASPSVDPALVCRASISLIFGQPVDSISTVKNDPIVELEYTRAVDNSDWKYRCKLASDEVIWAGFIDGEWGRWRDHAMDAEVTYQVRSDKLLITEKYPSSKSSNKTFDLDSL
jgi:hypothetical protein